jgi:hypothetical protein
MPFALSRAAHIGGRDPASEVLQLVVRPHHIHPVPRVVPGEAVDLDRPATRRWNLGDDLRLGAVLEPGHPADVHLRQRIGMLVLGPVQVNLVGLSCKPRRLVGRAGPHPACNLG